MVLLLCALGGRGPLEVPVTLMLRLFSTYRKNYTLAASIVIQSHCSRCELASWFCDKCRKEPLVRYATVNNVDGTILVNTVISISVVHPLTTMPLWRHSANNIALCGQFLHA